MAGDGHRATTASRSCNLHKFFAADGSKIRPSITNCLRIRWSAHQRDAEWRAYLSSSSSPHPTTPRHQPEKVLPTSLHTPGPGGQGDRSWRRGGWRGHKLHSPPRPPPPLKGPAKERCLSPSFSSSALPRMWVANVSPAPSPALLIVFANGIRENWEPQKNPRFNRGNLAWQSWQVCNPAETRRRDASPIPSSLL